MPATKSRVQAELHSLEAWVFNPLSWIDFCGSPSFVDMSSLTVKNYGFQSLMIFQRLQEIVGKDEIDLTLKLEGGTIFRDLKLVG